jgi:flagellar protein FlaG
MDVKAINNIKNLINEYDNSNVEQDNSVNANKEVVSIPNDTSNPNSNNDDSNKANNKKQLDEAIDNLNKYLKEDKTHAEYSYYKDFGIITIKIVDDDTKKVIMELPSEKILNVIDSICRQAGLFDKKV